MNQHILWYVKFRTHPPYNNSWNLNTSNAGTVNRLHNVKDVYRNNEDISINM
jgi:hypothetical protein